MDTYPVVMKTVFVSSLWLKSNLQKVSAETAMFRVVFDQLVGTGQLNILLVSNTVTT